MDLTKQLAAVDRTVEMTKLESEEEGRIITLSQSFPIAVPVLWDICTNPEKIKQYFSPVSGDLKVNGRFQIQNNASGTIESCIPNSSYRVTWEIGGNTSWVEIRTKEIGPAEARLELSHIAAVNKHWEEYGAGAGGVGWDMSFAGLAYYLKGIKVGKDWFVNDDTKKFLAKSSEAWGIAAVEGGEDPEAANAAVKRTTAFYVPS